MLRLGSATCEETRSQWGEPHQPFPPIGGHQYSWFGSPIGAINLELNRSGEYDRVFYLFWGYSFHAWYMDRSEARWMMSDIENLGPESN